MKLFGHVSTITLDPSDGYLSTIENPPEVVQKIWKTDPGILESNLTGLTSFPQNQKQEDDFKWKSPDDNNKSKDHNRKENHN